MIKIVKKNPWLFAALLLSFLYFSRKAIQYALIDSYVPSLLVSVFLFLILINLKKNTKVFKRVSRIWAILVIVWSSVRIVIPIMNYFTNTFDEYHLTYQFGVIGTGISLVMLFFGILILRNSNSKRLKDLLEQEL